MKQWLPVLIIAAIIMAVAFLAESWAAVAVIILCLIVYYIRLYLRTVSAPKRKLAAMKKEIEDGQQKTDNQP